MVIKHLPNKNLFQACRFKYRGIATSSNTPVLRFAPSPTGQLHLGGLRTALFNHLFARSLGGKWILRIEDTDQKRLVPGAVEAMQDILKWAGLDYDEGPDKPGNRGPYVQSERLHLYKGYYERLLRSGHAYRDFREPSKDGSSDIARDTYLPPGEDEAQEMIHKGKSFVVRFKTKEEDTSFDDAVYGHLKFPYDRRLEDPIIVKSDGWPTYHLANVVDDTEMGITHVFRGEEWLPSMPTHLKLYEALATAPPQFVHLPLLINPDGSKLSKRDAVVHVESYREAGYDPEALINFVALMGFNWHLPDSRSEVFSMEEMIAQFKLDRISQSRASPDVSKLRFLNKSHFSAKVEAASETDRIR
ncbi:Glutamyl/glutaminyl-tRNA synthetase, partial [Meira miltonrushii]